MSGRKEKTQRLATVAAVIERLKTLREAQNCSLRTLAYRTGRFAPQRISKWEKGEKQPSPAAILHWGRCLGCRIRMVLKSETRGDEYFESYETLAAHLHWVRRRSGLNLWELAQSSGYDEDTISRWERHKAQPSLQRLIDWCAALWCELAFLFEEPRP